MVHFYSDLFVPVVYHAWWPSEYDPFYVYNAPENGARVRYYPPHTNGSYYTPYAWIDGYIRGGYSTGSWGGLIQARYSDSAPLEILLDGDFNDVSRTGNLDVTIIAHNPINWNDLRIRIALTEDSIYYNAANGTQWHNYTMRDLLPDTLGAPLTISQGDTVVYSQSFSVPNPLVIDQCKLVVWVQADASYKEILQTARIWVRDIGATAVDDAIEIPSVFVLNQNYPNPFNAKTVISYSLEKESAIQLDIYDLSGRKITTLLNNTQPAGSYQAIWDGTDENGDAVSSGVYFYRLSTDGNNLTKRMVLLK